tara:strand:+ start:121 stop:888 length:768 start_codon:yes stop_codon:yes gene_type:complete
MTIISKSKNLLFSSIFSAITLSSLIAKPILSGQTFTPTKFLVKFYSLGLSNPDRSKLFKVFDNSEGVEVDLSKSGSISNLASGVKPVEGTYTHIYGVVSNTNTIAGSTGTCYIKAGSYNKKSVNGGSLTGWAAHTTNESESGDALLTEQEFIPGTGSFGPVIPNTSISVQGTKVSSMRLYLTNSSAPYTPSNDSNLSRDRSLYFGELPSPIIIKDASKGEVIITFDSRDGGTFDDNCSLGMDLINNKFTFSIIQD